MDMIVKAMHTENNEFYCIVKDDEGNIIVKGKQIGVGGDERYTAICRNCYKNKIKEIDAKH